MRGTRAWVGRWLARLAALLALAWGVGFGWFVANLPRAAPDDVRTDAIVVLTGDDRRIPRGLALLRAGVARRLLISGVGERTTATELAADAHVPRALFRCCVDLGRMAVDTRSNAEETAAWARAHGVRSLRLVTSDYHMRRAEVELAAELGPGIAIVPDAVPGEASPGQLAREYSKWAWRGSVRWVERA